MYNCKNKENFDSYFLNVFQVHVYQLTFALNAIWLIWTKYSFHERNRENFFFVWLLLKTYHV